MRSARSGAISRQPGVQLHPGHVRHHEVAQHEIEAATPPPRARRARRGRSCASRRRAAEARIRRTARPIRASSSTTRMRPRGAGGSTAASWTGAGGSAEGRAGGRRTLKMDPLPGAESTWISPPRPLTMPWQIESPSPVPTPTGFVVKKGSKMRGSTSGAMPLPRVVRSRRRRGRPETAEVTARTSFDRGAPLRDRLGGVDEEVQEDLPEPVLARRDEGDLAHLDLEPGAMPDLVLREPERGLEHPARDPPSPVPRRRRARTPSGRARSRGRAGRRRAPPAARAARPVPPPRDRRSPTA